MKNQFTKLSDIKELIQDRYNLSPLREDWFNLYYSDEVTLNHHKGFRTYTIYFNKYAIMRFDIFELKEKDPGCIIIPTVVAGLVQREDLMNWSRFAVR